MREMTIDEIQIVGGGRTWKDWLVRMAGAIGTDTLIDFVGDNLKGAVRDDTFSSSTTFINVYGA